jgi:hypothetical protein
LERKKEFTYIKGKVVQHEMILVIKEEQGLLKLYI